MPPAVQGELVGHLLLPRELAVLEVKADRIVVSVREQAEGLVKNEE